MIRNDPGHPPLEVEPDAIVGRVGPPGVTADPVQKPDTAALAGVGERCQELHHLAVKAYQVFLKADPARRDRVLAAIGRAQQELIEVLYDDELDGLYD